MSNFVFKTLLAIRVFFPPIFFSTLHPFVAMLFDEVVLDGFISPHHFFVDYIPEHIKGRHKLSYDLFLDSWGFLNGLLPVLYRGNKFYSVFERNRLLLLSLFVWKIIGSILIYKFKNYSYVLLFPNFYLAVYLSLSFCDFFNVRKNQGKITAAFILFFMIREVGLMTLNQTV